MGKDGVITVEESKTMETTTDMVEGMQLDRGYLSPNFVTDAERMECVLEEPLRQICQNAGFEGAIVAEKVRVSDKLNLGFNAETEQYGDLVESGVIDPTKVTRTALQNAASIASLMLTTEVMVAEIPEKRPAPASGGYGPEGMDY